MSTDTIALFDRSEVASPERLLEALSTNPDFAVDLINRYRHLWAKRSWDLGSSSHTSQPTLWGPGGFAIHFHTHIAQLYHMMPFSRFSGDTWHRDALRQASRSIGALLGSTSVI